MYVSCTSLAMNTNCLRDRKPVRMIQCSRLPGRLCRRSTFPAAAWTSHHVPMDTATLYRSLTPYVPRISCNVLVAEGCMNCHIFQLPVVTVSFQFPGSEVYSCNTSIFVFPSRSSIPTDISPTIYTIRCLITIHPSRALTAFNSPLLDPSYPDLAIWRSIYHTTLACWHSIRRHEVPFFIIGYLIGYSPSWHLDIGTAGW